MPVQRRLIVTATTLLEKKLKLAPAGMEVTRPRLLLIF